MSTAVAMAPSPAPHDRPSFNSELPPATTSPTAQRTTSVLPPPPPMSATPSTNAPAPAPARSGSGSPKAAGITSTAHKSSPPSASRNGGGPKIIVKKEPGSPDLPTARHRPRKLDLSKNTTNIVSPATGRPLTARDGGLGIQEVGLACLSPGFVTQDPVMKEQLQRSMSVREHQRQIIESRLQQQSAKGDGPADKDNGSHFTAKTPGFARKRGAPPGLSIVAPSHEQFAHERVIQSAPLGQTFTGRHNPHPLTRHITNQPSNLSNTSHIHHVPANQTSNRLPPIADVINLSGHPGSSGHALYAEQSRAPLASPRHPPPPEMTTPARPREYKSAEEAQVELAGGRPELLPKLVHYAGQHQPPTPPSPPSHHHASASRDAHYDQQQQRAYPAAVDPARNSGTNNAVSSSSNHAGSSMKRRRAEYEEGSPPLGGNGGRPAPPPPRRSGPFGEGRDSPDTQRAKREEFLKLCERAWDLFHS